MTNGYPTPIISFSFYSRDPTGVIFNPMVIASFSVISSLVRCRASMVVLCVSAFLLVLLAPQIAVADIFQSKDWHWSTDSKRFLYAGTINTDKQTFGQYCYLDSKRCLYLINPSISCRVNSELTALINSDKGAKDVKLLCQETKSGDTVFVVTPFDHIDFIVRQANYFSIAIPLKKPGFLVSHFSLVGSTYAIELMLAATEAIIDLQKESEVLPGEILL